MRHLVSATLLIGAAGCLLEPAHHIGSTHIVWSINSMFDPGACDVYGATDAIVELYFQSGGLATRLREPCDQFGVTVALDSNYYSASVTLVDPRLTPVSTSASIPAFSVSTDRQTWVNVNFRPSAFFSDTTGVPEAGLE